MRNVFYKYKVLKRTISKRDKVFRISLSRIWAVKGESDEYFKNVNPKGKNGWWGKESKKSPL